jgi:hypothetical protein
MKQPIKWHKECLECLKKSAARRIEAAKEAQADAERICLDVTLLESQIFNAEKSGKDGFYSEKYMVKRKVA